MKRNHTSCVRIIIVLLSLHVTLHMVKAQTVVPPSRDLRIDREIWGVPLYLLRDEMFEAAVPPKVVPLALGSDTRYFEHLGLMATPDGESRATKPGAEVDAVMTRYTLGKLKVETRQTVYVWALWIPFSEHFQSTDAPAQVGKLIPALQGKVTKVTREDGMDFYVSESGPRDGDMLLREMVVRDSGVLLWGLKWNPFKSPVLMSSQMWLNKGWFKSAESKFK